MAVIQPGVWGIDLGQCALKALRLENQNGQAVATAFDYVEHPKILSQPDADPDQLIREALEKFLSRNSLKGDSVAVSVPGQSGLARFVKLPPVEEKKITDIVRFEAKQQIPFNLDEVVWDYQKIGSGAVTDGFAMETEIGLFAMKRDMISRCLQNFKEVNVEVNLVQMAPLALCNFVSYDLIGPEGLTAGEDNEEAAGKKLCVVALDIGADNSNLVITDGDRIIWQRPIPLGGNHFTRALTKDLKLTFAKAEHLKRNATKSPDLKKILAALKPVLNDFVGEVQRSLGYFTNTHRNAHVAYLIGLGNAFRLPGMQRFLQEKLQLEVRKLSSLARLGGDSVVNAPVFVENLASFAVAYGLALQGLNTGRLTTNLLPQEIRVERLIRAKKPWAAAAAAALLLGTAIPMFGYYMDYRANNAPAVKKQRDISEQDVKAQQAEESRFDGEKRPVDELADNTRLLAQAQAGKDNIPRLHQFIANCLPRPDGSNLLNPRVGVPRTQRGDTKSIGDLSWRAFNELPDLQRQLTEKLRTRLGPTPSPKDIEDHRKDLDKLKQRVDITKSHIIYFNIEAVQLAYSKDLSTFLDQPAVKADLNSMRPTADKERKPEGAGWIVELRGFTVHPRDRTGQSYVIDCLIENIARKGNPQPPASPVASAPGGDAKPAAGNEAGEPAAKPAEKKNEDPVIGRISHVLLYKAAPDGLINGSSPLAQLAGGPAAATAATPSLGTGEGRGDVETGSPDGGVPVPGGPGGPGGPGLVAGGRVPLVAIGAGMTGSGFSGGFGGGKPGPAGVPLPGGPSTLPPSPVGSTGSPDGIPPGPGGVPGPGEAFPGGTVISPSTSVNSPVTRTEFIIWFLWKEPLPETKPADSGT
jgi:type IV pilus assembly protein PilM